MMDPSPVVVAESVLDTIKQIQKESDLKAHVGTIKWLVDVEEVAKLNRIVREKTAAFVEEARLTGKPLSPEVQAVVSGRQVYKNRFTALPILFTLLALCLISSCVSRPLTILVSALIMFFWYDFFSGVLHIVLDNPDFIHIPILDEPCLEFQWHHHNPLDLASKSFLEVCGDLNVVVGILITVYFAPYIGFNLKNPTSVCLIGFKVLMAYFGQLCHCMSHSPAHRRPQWVKSCQRMGLMISPRDHLVHHKNYDQNFCIGSGICNPLITWCLKNVTENKWIWLAFFAVSLVVDVPAINYILTAFAGFQ